MMAHITIGMQVSHVTKSSYSPFKSRLMLMQLIAIFLVYLMHLFALNKLGTKFYQDVINLKAPASMKIIKFDYDLN